MRAIDWSLVPSEGGLVLMTAREMHPEADLLMADFRDISALVHNSSGKFIGLSRHGVRLGKKPRLVNGLWMLEEDPAAQKAHPDVKMGPDVLSMEVIR